MTADHFFFVSNSAALLCWLLLICLPRYKSLSRFAIPVLACGLLGVCYVFLIVSRFGDAEGGFGTLDGVTTLFENRDLVLAGWIHYLAFDLFVGCWEVRDAQQHQVPHLWIVPALLLTFMFGPAGLLLYYAIRFLRTGNLSLQEPPAVGSL